MVLGFIHSPNDSRHGRSDCLFLQFVLQCMQYHRGNGKGSSLLDCHGFVLLLPFFFFLFTKGFPCHGFLAAPPTTRRTGQTTPPSSNIPPNCPTNQNRLRRHTKGLSFQHLSTPIEVPLSARMRRVLATAISIYQNLLPSHVCFGHDRSSLARAWSSTPLVHFGPGSWHSCSSSASRFCFCSFRAESLSMSCPLGTGGPSSRSPPGSLHFVWRCRQSLGSSPLEFHMGEGSSRAPPTSQPPSLICLCGRDGVSV